MSTYTLSAPIIDKGNFHRIELFFFDPYYTALIHKVLTSTHIMYTVVNFDVIMFN